MAQGLKKPKKIVIPDLELKPIGLAETTKKLLEDRERRDKAVINRRRGPR